MELDVLAFLLEQLLRLQPPREQMIGVVHHFENVAGSFRVLADDQREGVGREDRAVEHQRGIEYRGTSLPRLEDDDEALSVGLPLLLHGLVDQKLMVPERI